MYKTRRVIVLKLPKAFRKSLHTTAPSATTLLSITFIV